MANGVAATFFHSTNELMREPGEYVDCFHLCRTSGVVENLSGRSQQRHEDLGNADRTRYEDDDVHML